MTYLSMKELQESFLSLLQTDHTDFTINRCAKPRVLLQVEVELLETVILLNLIIGLLIPHFM